MPQNVAAVLQEALGRTGPTALPYAPEFRFLVQQHLTELCSDMPTLRVKTREYTHIDGRTAQLLLAEGTIPMYYQGVKYNIPVAVWLPEQYPLAAPLSYVEPTPDMVIRPRHPFVDASGLVHTQYIQHWQYPTSNLRELAQDMSMHFGTDPPLFSKPPGQPPTTGRPQQQVTQQQPPVRPPGGYPPPLGGAGDHFHNPLTAGQGSSFTTAGSAASQASQAGGGMDSAAVAADIGSGGFDSVWKRMMGQADAAQFGQQQAAAPPPPVVQPVPPVAKPPPPPPPPDPTPKMKAAFRAAAMGMLNKRLQASLTAVAQQAAAEADEQLNLQATLRQRGEQLQSEVAALQAERVALDKLSHDLAASSAQLDRWLSDNEHLAAAAEDPSKLDPDAVISAADPLSQQALEVQAQDLALEDALYALDKSLSLAAIESDVYLKQVRAICRRQFFVRALGNKVAVAQQEQQRRAPPPPLPAQRQLSAGRAVVLPMSDSWANAGIIANSREAPGWYPAQ